MLIAEPSSSEIADIIAINHLAVSYAEAVSRGEIDEAVQVYAVDGVLRSGTTDEVVGRDAIAAMITATTAGFDFVFQTVHQGLVEVHGDTARARVQITEWVRRTSDAMGLQFLGWYEDELIRTDEGWRYASRELVGRTLGKTDVFSGQVHEVTLGDSLRR